MVFNSEDHMQEELFRFLEERELKKTRHTMYFYREVPVYDMIPDILAFASSHIEAYELKLKACKKLHEQGIKVCRGFNRAYIVLPNEIEAEKMKKYRGEYGIYSFDGEKLKRIKMHNSVNDIKEPYDERHRLIIKFDAMNAVVRGFFVGGVNEQMKAGRPASRD